MDRDRDLGVVLVAAGAGRRFARAGGEGAKVLVTLQGKPLYRHALERFLRLPDVLEVVVVVEPSAVKGIEGEMAAWGGGRCKVTAGGARRQDSVARGLEALGPGARWVAVHDAARPAVEEEDVRATLARAREVGAAILARPSTDTLKEVAGGGAIARTLPRDRIWRAETPQIARRDLLFGALRDWPAGEVATDEAIALERAGIPVAVVAARHENPKVTVPADLGIVRAILTRRAGPRGADRSARDRPLTGGGGGLYCSKRGFS